MKQHADYRSSMPSPQSCQKTSLCCRTARPVLEAIKSDSLSSQKISVFAAGFSFQRIEHSCHTCRYSAMKSHTFCTSRVHKLSDTKRNINRPHCQTTLPTRNNTHALSDHAHLPVACHVMSIGTCQRARIKAYILGRKAARVCCCTLSLPQLMTSLTLCPTLCTGPGAICHRRTASRLKSHHSIEKAPVPCTNPDASQTATPACAS